MSMFSEEREAQLRVEIERLREVVRDGLTEIDILRQCLLEYENNYLDIEIELQKQDQKWGKQEHEMPVWLAIMTEEHGEIAKAVCDLYNSNNSDDKKKHLEQIQLELVQTLAVGIQWMKFLKENNYRLKSMPV